MGEKHIEGLLTEYFLETNKISRETKLNVYLLNAEELILPERIDLMAKLIYIEAKEKSMELSDAIELYTKHIETFSCGTFIEPGSDTKKSIEIYIKEFDNLIDSIKVKGFDEQTSLVPIGKDNILIDGAHRCAISAFYKKKLSVVKFEKLERNFDTYYFKDRGLNEKYLDLMSLKYVQNKKKLFLACIWPRACDEDKRKQAINVIKENGKIVYEKDVIFSAHGMHNFMIQVYGEQEWTGNYQNHHKGIKAKLDACFADGKSTKTVLFHCDSLDNVIRIKDKIRNIFKIDKHSVHITDNDKETQMLSNVIYNKNSRDFLEQGNPDDVRQINDIINCIKREKLSDNFIFLTQATMMLYGLREKGSIDAIMDNNTYAISEINSIKCCKKNDLLHNPCNYFVFNGYKFISFNAIIKYTKNKIIKTEKKDICKIGLFLFMCEVERKRVFITSIVEDKYLKLIGKR